jgi:fused signal recognition particle receptor
MTEQVTGVFTKKPLDQEQLDALEEMLIEADLGPQIAARITEAFGKARFGKSSTDDEVKEALAELVAAELTDRQGEFDPLSRARPYVVLFIGVNGSGKTTTLGKIAADLTEKGQGPDRRRRHLPRRRRRAAEGLGRPGRGRLHVQAHRLRRRRPGL